MPARKFLFSGSLATQLGSTLPLSVSWAVTTRPLVGSASNAARRLIARHRDLSAALASASRLKNQNTARFHASVFASPVS